MTLMTNRCVSVQGARDGALYSREMAWRGYHGNVYFEPIHVSKVGGNSTDQHHVLYLDKHAVVNPDNTQMHEELQVRISLRHMDARGDDTYPPRTASPYSTGGSIGVMEDLKPFIKYSPDVKAQYNRQIKYY
nr:hypothetical protein BaRGS_000762 [Batillaria attramentaria]